ncbi:MAG: TRAM domain-containing protein, partial [Chloroflexota bacterium]
LISIRVIRLWLHTGIRRLVGGACGLAAGAILAIVVNWGIPPDSFPPPAKAAIHGLILTLFGLVGMQLGYSRGPELRRKPEEVSPEEKKVLGILDTSVIIDGRIADVCETGFIDGDLIIPQFILKELQMIADSSEATRRTRGRRGLDILNKMQKQSFVKIIIEDVDFPSVKEVDQKLITLAKETGRAILTNDFNLNKVAEVHSIQVLNINQLANALKPVVLPGETMKAQIIKEGKEPSQGVAYLDDGTMVVIDHGKRFMGKTIEVTVTSVLQTTAGRMIFATIKS